MFASIDRDERRVITAELVGCDLAQTARVPERVTAEPNVIRENTYIHVSTFPTRSQLRRIGRQLLGPDSQHPLSALHQETRANGCEAALQLQAWRLVYDGQAMAYQSIAGPVEVQP